MMDIADYVMISFLPTTDAQTALLPAQVWMWSYIVIGLGVVSVIATFASQALGRGKFEECSSYAWQSLYVGAILGILVFLVRPFVPELIAAVGHEPRVQELEIAYLRIALLTTGPTIAAEGLGWFFIGVHRPWVTVWTAIEANVLNVAVCFVLIFGFFGFEPMGIRGVAWGTLVAVNYRMIRLSIAMLLPGISREFGSRRTWRPASKPLTDLLRVGLPCGFQWLSEVVVWALFVNVLIGTNFGSVHLTATNVAWQYMRVAFMPTIGMGRAVSALVGRSIGAGNPDRAVWQARVAAIITSAYMGSLSLIYFLFGSSLIGWFNPDPQVRAIGGSVMICAAAFQLFDGLAITFTSALRGAGDTFIPSIFFISTQWLIVVGGGWWFTAFYPELKSIGPWIAASTLIIVTAIFLWWRWKSGVWRRINLF